MFEPRTPSRLAILTALSLAAGCCATRYDEIPERTKEDFPSLYPEKRLALDPGMEIRYVEAGEGFPVVFLHGIGADHHQWNVNLPHFAERFRVLALDFPGHGKSSRTAGWPYSIERSADAVVALLDSEEISRAVLVGNSMGGMVALLVAVRNPERVERLVLADAAGGAQFDFFDSILSRSAHVVSTTVGMGVVSECFLRWGVGFVLEQNREHEIVEAYLRKTLLIDRDPAERGLFEEMIARTLESILDSDLPERVAAIDRPTLVVWGEDDFLIDVEYARELDRTLPRSLLAVFPETGHVPPLERPELFHAKVDLFLSDLVRP